MRKVKHYLSLIVTVSTVALIINACSYEDGSNSTTSATPDLTAESPSQSLAQAKSDQEPTKTMPHFLKQLQWVKSANAQQDLEQAIANGDYAFWMLAARAPVAPGLDQEKHAALLQKCGQKYIPGAGDTIFSSEHRELHKQALQYATTYNQALLTPCQNK